MKNFMQRLVRVLSCAVLLCASSVPLAATTLQERKELAHAAVLGIGQNERVIWKNLQNPQQRDVLWEPLVAGKELEYKNFSVKLFLTRAAKLWYTADDMFDMAVVKDIINDGYRMKLNLSEGGPDVDDYDTEEEFEAAMADFDSTITTRASDFATRLRTLLGYITFQEHKVGALLEKEWRYEDYYFALRTWAGVAERNYWLDEQYRTVIAQMVESLELSSSGQETSFNISDFVQLNWGIGDMHLLAGVVRQLPKNIELRAGAKVILPTARDPKRETTHQVIPLLANEFLTYLRARLNEVLIAPKLGNGGYFGGGLWADATWTHPVWNGKHELQVQAFGSVDYLLPAIQERLLLHTLDTSVVVGLALANDYVTNDAGLRSFIAQHIIPDVTEVVIAPGAIVNLGIKGQYRIDKTRLVCGYDWYFRGRERLTSFVDRSDASLFSPSLEAEGVSSSQHKLFASVGHNVFYKDIETPWGMLPQLGLSFGLQAAGSVGATGMGNDFNIGLTFGVRC